MAKQRLVKKGSQYGILDEASNTVLPISDNMKLVQKQGQYGFLDGDSVIPIDNFSESITEISNNGYSYGVAIKDLNSSISFFPQGLLMCFYGSLGLLLSIYWWLLIYWDVGGGFNEFNKKEGFMRIFRWGYPGKNRRIDLIYSLKDIEAIRVQYKESQSLFASDQTIYVKLRANSNKKNGIKENFEIPLGGIGQPLTLKEIEKQASELANFLQVSLEGL